MSGKNISKEGRAKLAALRKEEARAKRPDLSHIKTPEGSKAVPVGIKGDYALVDEEDYERVMEYNWMGSRVGYPFNNKMGYMHRFIMNTPEGMYTDHIDHDKYNNRKSNLRVCTNQQNIINSRQKRGRRYKGVHKGKKEGTWCAAIKPSGMKNTIRLGTFNSEEEAAKAYDAAAKKYHKDFAYLNFP